MNTFVLLLTALTLAAQTANAQFSSFNLALAVAVHGPQRTQLPSVVCSVGWLLYSLVLACGATAFAVANLSPCYLLPRRTYLSQC